MLGFTLGESSVLEFHLKYVESLCQILRDSFFLLRLVKATYD